MATSVRALSSEGLRSVLLEELEAEDAGLLEQTVSTLEAEMEAAGKKIKVSQEPGSARVEIEFVGKNAIASFDCRDVVPREEYDEEMPDDDEEPNSYEFELEVKNKDEKTIVFECQAQENTTITINSVSYYKSSDLKEDATVYDAPNFDELDPRLQAALYSYVEAIGCDAGFANVVATLAQQKESAEYYNWLTNLKDFLPK